MASMILRAAAPEETTVFHLYHYDPTTAGAMIFLLLFLGSTLLHTWQLLRSRCWFAIPLAVGGLFEVIGYGGRFASGQEEGPNWSLGPYICQAILLLVAPALFAATIYMALARIVEVVDGESRCLIRRKWMTKIFVVGDVFSFVLQGGGGGYQSSGTLDALDTGANIIIAGLFVQLLCFGIFIAIAISFHLNINKAPTGASNSDTTWRRHMMALYIGSVLIMIRSVFRAVEYLQGFDGYLLSHEVYLYVFDAALMFLTMVLFNYIHPKEIMALLKMKHNDGRIKIQFANISTVA